MRLLRHVLPAIVGATLIAAVPAARDSDAKPASLTLPFSGSAATSNADNTAAVAVRQTAAGGGDAIYGATNATKKAGVLAFGTGNHGYGVYAVSSGPGGAALLGYNTATGNAGYFLMVRVPFILGAGVTENSTIYAENSSGSTATGEGLYGPAGSFVVSNSINTSPTIFVQSINGTAVEAQATAGGAAGTFIGGFEGGNGECSFAGGANWECAADPNVMRKHSERVDPQRVLRQ